MKNNAGIPGSSAALREWLKKRIDSLRPGSRLPSYRELAGQCGLSGQTVRNVLREFADNGSIVTIHGKGSFVPSRPGIVYDSVSPLRSSSDSIAETILSAIISGELKRGDALPAVKYLSKRFNTAAATVTSAYRRLHQQGHISRIGKTYWVGGTDLISHTGSRRDIYFCVLKGHSYHEIFKDIYYSDAYRKMVNELSRNNFNIVYMERNSLSQFFSELHRRRNWPHGIFIYRVGGRDTFSKDQAALRAHQKDIKTYNVSVLLDIGKDGASFNHIPGRIQLFSRGHVFTEVSRSIARHIVQQGNRNALLFFDESQSMQLNHFLSYLRVYSEILSLESRFSLRFIIKALEKKPDLMPFLSRLFETRSKDVINDGLSKYKLVSIQKIQETMRLVEEFETIFNENRKKEMTWIFADDTNAVMAARWAKNRGIPIPRQLNIISMENSPDFYPEGISACVPDWDRIGYLLAHAVTGDFSIPKTSKGFIKTAAMFLRRNTSV